MTAHGAALREAARLLLAGLAEFEKREPEEVSEIVTGIVQTISSWRPEALRPLASDFHPTELVVDPRPRR